MPALRASASIVLLATMTGFAGAGGWASTVRAAVAVELQTAAPEAAPVDQHAGHATHTAPAPAAAGHDARSGHHSHSGPPAAAPSHAARPHHEHDCEKGVCRCDSRCPMRRTGPCGGAMRSCQGERDQAGFGPGPVRPFLLSAAFSLRPVFEGHDRPDVAFVPLTRALEPVSPPPRSSFV